MEMTPMDKRKISLKLSSERKNVFLVYAIVLVLFLTLSILSPSYRKIGNISNILIQCIPLAIASLGQTIVMISGGIDLSVGSVISLTACILATLMKSESAIMVLPALLIAFMAAMLTGAFIGVSVNYLRVPPMIASLSMMIMLNGVAQFVMPVAGGKIPKFFAALIMMQCGFLSVPLLILSLCFIILQLTMSATKFGPWVYAIGKDRDISSAMGVNVKKTSVIAFIISSITAAITGLILACRMRIGDPLIGTSFGLDSITAAAIGGTALSGGYGGISGTIAGAFLIGMLSNMMNIIGVNHFYQYVLKGLLLVFAMILYSISKPLFSGKKGKE